MKKKLPDRVKYIIDALNKNNYDAYAVGGCIRDTVMGKTPSDWDICTSSTPEETLECLNKRNVSQNGLKHGTVTVVYDKIPYEITTFRVDGEYTDNRRPEAVSFVRSLREDIDRRDFTINAIAYNDRDGLRDYYNGEQDIKNKLIKCVGDPDKRFGEDALRILRALRFSSVLGFNIDRATSDSIHKNKALLKNISAERINAEFTKMLVGENIESVLTEYSDVICVFIPELEKMMGFSQQNPHHIYDVWQHTVKAVKNVPGDKELRLAALFHDIGKPHCFTVGDDGKGHFYGHQKISAGLATQILKRLKLDNKTAERVVELVEWHDVQIIAEPKYVRRFIVRFKGDFFDKLLLLKRGDILGQNPDTAAEKLEYINKLRKIYDENKLTDFTVNSLAVNGNDLMSAGVSEGREIGDYKNRLFKSVVDGVIENDYDVLMEQVRKWKMSLN